MTNEDYEGRKIQVVSFDDATSDEHVIEFIDPAVSSAGSVVAVFNRGSDWRDARVSINPKLDGVSAEFLIWALNVARRMM
ncbi:hypothetical protein SAMN05443287_1153 [Micromonospora phaseoli]|uniref:Uncharacterized protein n=1 Tax=Micromonospora phaseoli TaxID=1144548 RepID=A0A1H7DT67_9ACTN|nr:hypothetical protein [Micromonospora phaseoli]PZV89403.1 hypothetical protein CLV64_1153 [Micromonospora phaseoli]GIJ81487.1 hypothetical protein Xph01_59190 [Micromonospora phaseoli]SEK02500.1 hypothetical protein SAMN05443287_1153 [Micromonospora phaseoli]